MARKATRKQVAPEPKRATVFLIIAALLAVTALPIFILFAAGMLPSIVAAIVDGHPRRYLSRAVAATNLAGMVPAVAELWRTGVNLGSAERVLGEPMMWLIMYGAAGLGWLLYLGMPFLARAMVDHRADQLQRRLEKRAETLIEEWGEEVNPRKSAQG